MRCCGKNGIFMAEIFGVYKIDNFYSVEAKTLVFLSELRIYILSLHKKSENQVFSNTFIIFFKIYLKYLGNIAILNFTNNKIPDFSKKSGI